jgi:hypothetical protein
MTGAEKFAATLVGAIIMLSALGSSAQQPSNVAADTRRETSATPTSTLPRLPADMPPNPPKVTCNGDKLTISAQNSTLGAVLNAVRACIGAEIDVPEDARGERLFAELGPGPIRAVLADFLSSTDFNYVIKASPSDPQKVQMVLLNPRTSDSASEVATVADSSTNLTPSRRGWLKARENYMKSFTAAQDDSNQQADTASSAPVEATAPAASSAPVEATAPAASSVPVEATARAASSAPVEATAPAASSVPVEATAPAASSVPLEAQPASPAPAASPVSPTPESSPVPSPAADPIASTSTGSDTASSQGKSTQEMISNMQRMFEQRKQMVQQQQQQTSAPPP